MINHRARAINPNPLFHHAIANNEALFHTHSPRPPQRATSKLRKRIPFVTQVKEVEDPEDALSLFHRYKELGFKHYYPSYAALLYKLARSRKFQAVEAILTHMKDTDMHCRETLFIALFQHYGPQNAVDLFRRMPQFNCVRTLQSFNALLNVLVDNDRFSEALDAFARSYEMGFRPNTVTFNIMMKGWLAKGEWGKACEVFDEMLQKRVQPSVVTYNSLIGFLSRKGDLDKAMALLEDMKRKGKRANEVTYALLMEGLCTVEKYEEAKKLMFDMAYRGCKPQLVNFSVLMNDLGKRGKIDEAKALLREMKKRRLKPDVVTYNVLINYLCKEGKTAEAYKVLIEMQIGGCEPNAATYRMMVDGLCRTGDFETGLNVFNAMLASRHCPRPETFNCLAVGLLNSGNIDGACFVLEEMEKRKIDFDLESWEAVIRYSLEYLDKDETIVAHMVRGSDACIKLSHGWPIFGSPLKLIYIKGSDILKRSSPSFHYEVEGVFSPTGSSSRKDCAIGYDVCFVFHCAMSQVILVCYWLIFGAIKYS